jgi:hypothetical protein
VLAPIGGHVRVDISVCSAKERLGPAIWPAGDRVASRVNVRRASRAMRSYCAVANPIEATWTAFDLLFGHV